MTGREALDQALQLLGYDVPAAGADGRGLLFVDRIARELWRCTGQGEYIPPEGPDAPLPDMETIQALPLGVAMLLAQAAGDGGNQALYAALYDRGRAASVAGVRRDVMPG